MKSETKPSIFLGSSSEGENIARALEMQLVSVAESTLWRVADFVLSNSTLESLVDMLDRFDFAVLVMTPDDIVISRDEKSQRARDNVMFELGLFMGRLGRARTFVVCDPNVLTLPSDLAGITCACYDSIRAQSHLDAAVSVAATKIRVAIQKLGVFEERFVRTLQKAAADVEQIFDLFSHVVHLVALSRSVELDAITKQSNLLISSDNLKRMQSDVQELKQATQASEDVFDYRARVKLVEFSGIGKGNAPESYLLSNGFSDVIIKRMLANRWIEHGDGELRITDLGKEQIRRQQNLRQSCLPE